MQTTQIVQTQNFLQFIIFIYYFFVIIIFLPNFYCSVTNLR